MKRALLYCGGDLVVEQRIPSIENFDLVIAADSGASQARGGRIDIAVGDFDSIDPNLRTALERDGTELRVFPAQKDFTDLELAFAAADGFDEITVVGGGGGRIDHLLANAAVISARRSSSVVWILSDITAYPVRHRREIPARIGATLSVIAIGGVATGVTLRGCTWNLTGADLDPYAALGVSNIVESTPVTCGVEGGVVLVCVQA